MKKYVYAFIFGITLSCGISLAQGGHKNTGVDTLTSCDGTTCTRVTIYWHVTWEGQYVIDNIVTESFPDPNHDQEPPLQP